ncbi:MAG: PTS sugar transporter subunit IIA [Brevinematales bacterium]|jgi:mannitol/fructose-specific phosphotransferase system IIA component (Ntr-type)
MRLSELLKPEFVKIGLNGKTKDELLQEIADFISVAHTAIDKKDAYKAISEREKKGSTGLGNGLAIPHGRSARVNGMHLVVIYDEKGKDFEAYDKKLSHLFFAAVTSEDYSPHEQLEVLRIIAEIYEKTDIGMSISGVKNSMDVYNLLMKKEEEIS